MIKLTIDTVLSAIHRGFKSCEDTEKVSFGAVLSDVATAISGMETSMSKVSEEQFDIIVQGQVAMSIVRQGQGVNPVQPQVLPMNPRQFQGPGQNIPPQNFPIPPRR